ncbi:PAS domain-containing sensor histidine kinase [Mucilaginibacter sp. JRF]|uniref:sensor histidine kinase n=1 Tax=Mucilaginibacter sp. JRF TaxID=2780088 RepID=UPI001880976C|nr:PAS domain-containing sensor histidine kinase [Mucilaginibacter sp. JRF]MBE9584238.1 PAS domain-containing sensor histidine kinase [Mucilaginibacter sp. JRF]
MEGQAIIDLEELYQQAPCGYFSLSPSGNIIKINQTLLGWLGYELNELHGKKFSGLLSKGGQMHFEMFFWPMAAVNRGVRELSYEVLKKDGVILPVLLNASAKLDEANRLLAINVVLTDITERKTFEKELLLSKKTSEREQKRLQFMADLVPEIIWTATPDGYVDYVNARFCQYFDCNGQDTRVSFIMSKVHPDDRRALSRDWRESLISGESFEKRIRLIDKAGIYEWHLLKAALFLDEEGNLTNWFGSCANINEHVQDMKKKDEFINIASHELKTPITSLKALLQLLDRMKGDLTNKMAPGLIEKSNRNVNRISELVTDLLSASQFNDGQLRLNKTEVNLAELIGDYVHHIRIDQKYEIITEGEGVTVIADEGRIEQVLSNLITNAIKYAPESNVIRIRLTRTLEFALVEIIDEGPGITPEKLPHLFDRYYQVSNTGSLYSGLGLGLYICAEIIKKHRGEIGAKSVLGEGSTFWFTLPFNPSIARRQS